MSVTYYPNVNHDDIESAPYFNVSNANHASILSCAGLQHEYVGEIAFDRFMWGTFQTYFGELNFSSKVAAAAKLVDEAKALGATNLYFG